MNGFDVLQAMEQIDDKYIEEANQGIALKHTRKRFSNAHLSIAALLLISIIAAAVLKELPGNNRDTVATVYEEASIENEIGISGACLESTVEMQEAIPDEAVVESTKGDYPALIQVNGIVYRDSGESSTDARCGVMDGEITTQCDEIPTEDNQSNFGTGYGYQIGKDRIDVLIDDQWHIFVPYQE